MVRKRKTSPIAPVAVVTGAGKRLGRQIALALAEAGFDLVLHYRSSGEGVRMARQKIASLGRRSISVRGDLRKSSDVKKLIRKAEQSFGRVDLLVNNAAVFRKASLSTTTESLWDEALETNLKAPFLAAQAVAPIMKRQGGGKVINIASLGGLQAWKEHLPYSISKAGVIMLTRILARELAPEVQVNAIAPGTIIVPGEESPDIRHVATTTIPLQRYGKPSDIADLVVFLATKSAYVTGQIIAVDGGRSVNLSQS